jgi:hypothetical protein
LINPGIRNKGKTKPNKKPVIALERKVLGNIPVKSKMASNATITAGINKTHIPGIFTSFKFLTNG